MLKKPFIYAEKNSYDRYSVISLFGNKKAIGQVGLEVEVEGNMFPKSSEYNEDGDEDEDGLIPYQWRYTHDGSLRGNDNAEYVLNKPLMFEQIPQAVNDLWDMFDNYGSVLDESNRTSVHVHLNVQEFRLNRLCAFSALYFCVEEILTAWCGDHRVGNLFCLRAKDAPAIISKLRKFIVTSKTREIAMDEGLHYAGFNIQALSKFGSIEIRTLRGAREPDTIITWVGILERLYRLSEEYQHDPRTVIEGFSGRPYTEFLERILGPYTEDVINQCGLTPDEVRSATLDGVRIAQHLCYCRDWSEFPPEGSKPDPFGRSLEKVESVENAEAALSLTSIPLPSAESYQAFVAEYMAAAQAAPTMPQQSAPMTGLFAAPADPHQWLDTAFPPESDDSEFVETFWEHDDE
jgi:hypothetical protein